MAKDKKNINPADAFRREEKKRQQKKQEAQRKVVREVRGLLNDPEKIEDEIKRVQKQSDENKLDKSLKDRIIELRNMKAVAMKKREMDAMLGKKPTPSSSSSSAAETSIGAATPQMYRPVDSIYFHPVHNPTGAPPPGMKPMFRNTPGAPQLPTQPFVGVPAAQPHAQSAFGLPRSSAPRPTMIMGGMNGIPLPPPRMAPRPGMSAPQMYVPGGSIPPPPPPPMMQVPAMQSSFPAHPTPVNPRVNKPQKDRKQAVSADPLDPSADGYVHRFGRSAREERQPVSNEEPDRYPSYEMNASNYPQPGNVGFDNPFQNMPAVAPEEAEGDVEDEDGEDQSQEDQDGDYSDDDEDESGDDDEDDENDNNGELHPEREDEEAAPQQNTNSTFDYSLFASQTLSAEELLARKNKAIPANLEEDSDREETVGPSAPPVVTFDFAAAFKAPMLSTEELLRRRKAMMEEAEQDADDAVGPAMPPVSEEYAAFAPLPGYDYEVGDEANGNSADEHGSDSDGSGSGGCLLPGMDAYGDSDEEEVTPKGPEPSRQLQPQPSVLGKRSIESESYANDSTLQPSLSNSNIDAFHVDEVVVKKPKVIQADHAVTAFVPNILKNKKPVGKFVPKPPTLPPPPTNTIVPGPVNSTLEDAYNQFLNEIEGL